MLNAGTKLELKGIWLENFGKVPKINKADLFQTPHRNITNKAQA